MRLAGDVDGDLAGAAEPAHVLEHHLECQGESAAARGQRGAPRTIYARVRNDGPEPWAWGLDGTPISTPGSRVTPLPMRQPRRSVPPRSGTPVPGAIALVSVVLTLTPMKTPSSTTVSGASALLLRIVVPAPIATP